MQIEKQDHDASKSFIKKLKEQNDELLDKIRVDKKRYDQLQDDVERFDTLQNNLFIIVERKNN